MYKGAKNRPRTNTFVSSQGPWLQHVEVFSRYGCWEPLCYVIIASA